MAGVEKGSNGASAEGANHQASRKSNGRIRARKLSPQFFFGGCGVLCVLGVFGGV